MKTPAIFIPEAFEDIFSADQQSQSLSQKQLQNEFMRPSWYYENFHFCQAGETIFFFKYENYRETSKNPKLCWTARLSDPVANAITSRKERTLRTRYKLLSEVRYFVYLARNVRFKKVLCQEWPPDFWSKWIVLV